MSNFKSLGEYFSDKRLFVVPYYQRGYKWSLQRNDKRGDLHLKILLNDLKVEFNNAQREGEIILKYEYYLQGITVKETPNEIELVDGQQRTTSLFIIFCVLKNKNIALNVNLESKLTYRVRESANKVLQGFLKGVCEGDENVQDIAALKKAWLICEEALAEIENLELFAQFLQDNIKIIYIKLDQQQDETKVFSMMNKDKADMTQTDLIKSNLLREASRQFFKELQQEDNEGVEWQINQLRSKLAIEWDNWRKWWENDEHISFGKMISLNSTKKDGEPGMAILFRLYQKVYETDEFKDIKNGMFEYFKLKIADKNESVVEAIKVFEHLRLIQNVIQEWYNDVNIYNYCGLLYKGCGLQKKEERLVMLVKKYIHKKTEFWLELKSEYINEILADSKTREIFINSILHENDAYHKLYTIVARQLLRMNVIRATHQKHKFDFTLYDEDNYQSDEIDNAGRRSLEHIKPQTYRNSNLSTAKFIELESLTNTVGNLVLVPKGLNSKLSNRSFDEKKQIVFGGTLHPTGKNYGLWLHTISIFGSNTNWMVDEINLNKDQFEKEFYSFFKSTNQ